MLTQDVSKIPISLSTPSKMSRMTSGGMRSERISESASDLMFPTALLASSTRGWRAEREREGRERGRDRERDRERDRVARVEEREEG